MSETEAINPQESLIPPQRHQKTSHVPLFKPIAKMSSLFLVGLLSGVYQHCFYAFIDGREPDRFVISQAWVIRIGTASAFLFQTALVASVGMAFTHISWFYFQRKAISVDGINAIFKVLGDPLQFFETEILLKTRILCIIALVSWLLPISAIFGPGALTVVTSQQISENPTQVPSVGFLNGSASFYKFDTHTPPRFGGPTPPLSKLAMRVFTGGEIIYWPTPCGVNCTYSIIFEGPAYDCADYAPYQLSDDMRLLYVTSEGLVDPPSGYNYTEIAGTYKVSDGIWINRTITSNYTVQVTHCSLHTAIYTVNVSYDNNLPTITANVVLGEPIFSCVFSDLVRILLHELPADNSSRLLTLTNFYAIEQAIEGLLSGNLILAEDINDSEVTGTSNVLFWNFVDYGVNMTPVVFPQDFSRKVEQLLINTTLSLMYFLQNPLPMEEEFPFAEVVPAAINSSVTARIVSYPTRYSYSARTLWEIYAASLATACICIGIGSFALLQSGILADMSFSQVLSTTRNPSLDLLCDGSCLGGEAISSQLRRTKLIFGELTIAADDTQNQQRHVCFGLEQEIMPIRKDSVYVEKV